MAHASTAGLCSKATFSGRSFQIPYNCCHSHPPPTQNPGDFPFPITALLFPVTRTCLPSASPHQAVSYMSAEFYVCFVLCYVPGPRMMLTHHWCMNYVLLDNKLPTKLVTSDNNFYCLTPLWSGLWRQFSWISYQAAINVLARVCPHGLSQSGAADLIRGNKQGESQRV